MYLLKCNPNKLCLTVVDKFNVICIQYIVKNGNDLLYGTVGRHIITVISLTV